MKQLLFISIMSLSIAMVSGCEIRPLGQEEEAPPTTGLYKSMDNGDTWEFISDESRRNGLRQADTYSLIADPSVPSVIFWGGETGLYRSWDNGVHWQSLNRGLPAQNGYVDKIFFDPQDTNTIYVVGQFDGLGRIFRAGNGGGDWERIYSDLELETSVTDIAINPKNTNILYATSTSKAFLRSFDRGATWQALAWFKRATTDVAVYPEDTNIIFVSVARDGIHKTENEGKNWVKIVQDGFPSVVRILAINPLEPKRIYAATEEGLYYSSNLGKEWQLLTDLIPVDEPDITALAFHPTQKDTLYLASLDTIYITYNHGLSWDVKKIKLPHTIYDIIVDASDPDILYAGVGNY
ncbi:MAG TPA: hypothetical protein PKL83_01450 [bacterium]|nr:hypothetical protein [bacterium]